MRSVSISFLGIFCILLGVQVACAAGLPVHEICHQAENHHDHEDDCQWDPCAQGQDLLSLKNRAQKSHDFRPAEDVIHPRISPPVRHRCAEPSESGNAETFRPPTSHPLLI